MSCGLLSSEEKPGQSTVIEVAGHGLKWVSLVGIRKGSTGSSSFAYLSLDSNHQGLKVSSQITCKPANVVSHVVLAEEAEKIVVSYSDVMTAKILDTEECVELKMCSYLSFAAASTNPPKFTHLCYKPQSESVKTKLAIVGKGLNFDSGGNIKTGPGMTPGVSSVVLGAVKAIGQIKPQRVEVKCIVAACESMISGIGMTLGDISTTSNGKTIKVNKMPKIN
ncbi:leucine aminopeptidase 1-like protein [Tanacetum coccineum]